MSWRQGDRDRVKTLLSGLWPSAKLNSARFEIYEQQLSRFAVSVVVRSLKTLSAERERLPTAGMVRGECAKLSARSGRGDAPSPKAQAIGRLAELANEGRNWFIDPRDNRMWTVHPDGFISAVFVEGEAESERFRPLWGDSLEEIERIEAMVKEQEAEEFAKR